MPRILVLNSGSSSQKCSLFELPDAGESRRRSSSSSSLGAEALIRAHSLEPVEPVWEAKFDATEPGQPEGKIALRITKGGQKFDGGLLDVKSGTAERTERLLRLLWEGEAPAIRGPGEVEMMGHRVVHGGAEFTSAAWVTPEVEAAIERHAAFAPLHNETNLTGIRVARELLGERVRHAAVFDTAFHHTLAPAAFTYAGPQAWLGQGIRRYGFHGTSFRWASEYAGQLLGRMGDPALRLILCHLGGGCSLCATVGGRSVDTTMGFTPLDGIAMCTRSGAVDPGILFYLLRQGATVDDLERMLNKESGLAGLAGMPGDTRLIEPAAVRGNGRARLALEVFIHRLRQGIGQMLASLGDAPHAIVFTDAMGEDAPEIRAAVCEAFAFLGLQLDPKKNAANPPDSDLAMPLSEVRALLVKSREAWQIAREVEGKL